VGTKEKKNPQKREKTPVNTTTGVGVFYRLFLLKKKKKISNITKL
jgi:hypothetical protein